MKMLLFLKYVNNSKGELISVMGDVYSPVVTKNELIDILYEKNIDKDTKSSSLTKDEINSAIDIIVENEDKNNEIYSFFDVSLWDNFLHKILMEKNISKDFGNLRFFNVNTDKYIFLKPIENENDIKILDYILNQNLNEGKKDNCLRKKRKEYIDIFMKKREQNKTIEEKFREYDCIKVICDNEKYNNIGISDFKKCLEFLKEHEDHNYLSVDDQIMLKLIILYGIRNIYLNTTEYYQYPHREDLNDVMKNLGDYISYILQNNQNVKDEFILSLNDEYSFNLYEFLHNENKDIDMSVYEDGFLTTKNIVVSLDKISLYNGWSLLYFNSFSILVRYLTYINFDYYISENNYDEAKKIYETDLDLFKYFKNQKYNIEDMINEVKLNTNDSTSKCKRNIKVILKFYISCYYYFKHFKDETNADKVYEFLLYFKDGYNIEDFILKCRYIKMAEELNGNKTNDINNIEEVNNAINKLNERISSMNLVNQFDIDDVVDMYNNIKFKNFNDANRDKVKKYIATGDKIMNTFNAIDIDFSSAVIEWSKAVETEIDEKLFSNEIISYKDKEEIERKFIKTDFKGRELHFRLKRQQDITVGIFNDMENYLYKNINLSKYLYDKYFSQYYDLDAETYEKLCEYLKAISTPRNESAHKNNTINKKSASDCKDKILASEKILEILSKLEKK